MLKSDPELNICYRYLPVQNGMKSMITSSKYQSYHVTEYDASTIIKQMADTVSKKAFYICDLSDIINKYNQWIKELPRVTVFYAVKCNPHPIVLQLLASLGANFDCASKNEIEDVLSLGVSSDRISYTMPCKLLTHMQYAREKNIKLLTFDCEQELMKIRDIFPEAETILRFRYDDPSAIYSLGEKFGCDPDTEAEFLLGFAKSLNIKVVGTGFHIGSGSKNPYTFRKAIKKANKIFEIAKNLGFDFKVLNLGGGYLGNSGTSIYLTATIINQALDEFFPNSTIKVISEPGRYFVSSAYTLAAKIHTVKTKYFKDVDEKYYQYYIDDGIYTSFNGTLFNEEQPGYSLKDTTCQRTYPSVIWGQTADSADKISKKIMLPKLEMGDWLVFPNMGAYTISLCSKFNGFDIPHIYAIANGKTWDFIKNNMCEVSI